MADSLPASALQRLQTAITLMPPTAKAVCLMIFSALMFQSMNAVIRHVSDLGLHPFEIAFFRNFFGLLAAALLVGVIGAGAWGTALAIKMVAYVGVAPIAAAASICARASRSSGVCTARCRAVATRRMPSTAMPSASG